jgi:glycosyltransferase involved in cell wall biosynthesis
MSYCRVIAMGLEEQAGGAQRPEFSFVVPIYDEAECLPELVKRLDDLMERLNGPAEVVLVDDGSRDGSYDLIVETCERDPRFKTIQFSRNFGHQVAITAGLDFASGDAVVVMDADLQDPPEVVLEMVERWRDGYDVVHAVREARTGESAFKRASAALFYRFIRKLSDVEIPADAGDFRLIDRQALDAFKQMRESNRYVRGMFGWIGFKQTTIRYVRAPRFAGTSKYPLRKMIRFALDGIIGFSSVPLRIALQVGFLLSALSIGAGILAIILKLTGAFEVPGWASLIVAITFLGGVQLSTLGVLGEYVSRIQDQVRGRPLYFVRDARGFPALPSVDARRRTPASTGDEERSGVSPTSSR